MNNTTKLSLAALLGKCSRILNVNEMALMTNTGNKATEWRYLTFEVMEKAGYTHEQIAAFFKISRESVTRGLGDLDVWKRAYRDIRQSAERLNNLIFGRRAA